MVKVSIVKTENNFYAAFIRAMNDIGKQLIAPGDCVLIKPNLVETADPDSGRITNPKVIEAVARYCLDYGATRVIIGEGPSYYQPQSRLRECFTRTGVSEVADRLGIEWVLFDEHRYRILKGVSDYTPDEFGITEFAFTCDKFINLPVLKTHYLTTVTLAMKDLKGCLRREDKPLFHRQDLSRAVVELCKIVRPSVNVIDCTPRAVVRELGAGYSSEGRQSGSGLLIASSDIVATDAVGCALMGIDPAEVHTVTLGAAAGLGESNLTRIDIIGEEPKRLKFKVKLPQEKLRQSFPLLEIIGVERACSGCLIPLLSSLLLLVELGTELEKPLRICLGKDPEVPEDKAWLLVGDCAQIKGRNQLNWVGGCPPSREELLGSLMRCMSKK
ncbi:DUF362 domain-containing protein [Chloroflexota bacterium]